MSFDPSPPPSDFEDDDFPPEDEEEDFLPPDEDEMTFEDPPPAPPDDDDDEPEGEMESYYDDDIPPPDDDDAGSEGFPPSQMDEDDPELDEPEDEEEDEEPLQEDAEDEFLDEDEIEPPLDDTLDSEPDPPDFSVTSFENAPVSDYNHIDGSSIGSISKPFMNDFEAIRKSVRVESPKAEMSFPNMPPSLADDVSLAGDHKAPLQLDFGSLSAGLAIKEPPSLFEKNKPKERASVTVKEPEASTDRELPASSGSGKGSGPIVTTNSAITAAVPPPPPAATTTATTTETKKTVDREGYIFALGKYEGDPFEPLFLKVDKSQKLLHAMLESGEKMKFDLSRKAFIFEDTVDANTIVLDFRRDIIIFKFMNSEELIDFMKNMPEEVFFAADVLPDEEIESVVSPAKKEPPRKKSFVKPSPPPPTAIAPPAAGTGPKIEHIKGTSVEDILENDFETTTERQVKIEQMFQVKESAFPVPQPPARRKELIDSYLRKPQYSVRRVTLLCEWINSLRIWPNKLSIQTLHKEFCNGLLLARIVKKIVPDVQFVNLNEKPLAKKAALENLEQAIGHIWRAKSLNNSRIPTADDIYSGNTAKTAVFINELFSVYVLRPLLKNALKIMRWYHYVLKQYERPLPQYLFEEGDLSSIWPHFQSGTALFCIIYHFFGQAVIGSGASAQRVDPLRIVGDPASICDFRENLSYVFHLLRLLDVDILWTAEDWISNPDTEFILLQLAHIYELLKLRQCSLPPAQGDNPGITSGPNGEALVVGLIFSDAPSSLRFIPRTQKAVRLGHDKDSMPLLPINKGPRNPRFFSHGILPQGMLSQPHVKVAETQCFPTHTQSNAQSRVDWNARTTVRSEHEGQHVVKLLRGHHKQTDLSSSRKEPSNNPASNRTAVQRALSQQQEVVENDQPAALSLTARDDMSREVNEMVRALEEEMAAAQRKIVAFEDELAEKYALLETHVDSTPLEEYESALLKLEEERLRLNEEKLRLQEYFSRKLSLIRVRKDEINQNHLAKQRSTFSHLLNISQSVDKDNSSKEEVVSPPMKSETKKANKERKTDVSAAEKGWISLSAKMDTHNFHLRNKQALSASIFQAKVTPKALLARQTEDASRTRNRSDVQDSHINFEATERESPSRKASSFLSPEELVQDTFQKFLIRLKHTSEKWNQARFPENRVHSSIKDMIQTKTSPHAELISVPLKSTTSAASSEKYVPDSEVKSDSKISSKSLRFEELKLMFSEDERRRMVMAEEKFEMSVQRSISLFSEERTVAHHKAHEEAPVLEEGIAKANEALHIFESSPPSAEEVNIAVEFLSSERLLLFNERSAKEFMFSLVEVERPAANGTDLEVTLAFQWRDHMQFQADDAAAGLLLLEDIFSLEVQPAKPDGMILLVHIKESSRAIKYSKGRTVLPLRFFADQECVEFCFHLSCLLSIS